jgi:hypothetical protein
MRGRIGAFVVAAVATWLMLGVAEGQSTRPDFHVLLQTCRIMVGLHESSGESIKTVEGELVYNVCMRRSRQISCALGFLEGGKGIKGETAEYSVVLDSPPHLHFAGERYADYFSVNLSNHSVVFVGRYLSEQAVGAKVCHGLFATDDEIQALGPQFQRRPRP